eukprot:TRINITY_DN1690_c0_g1_i10.p1 TRINITY_DN1690_c0_g1~~TRINITY_DN1690_c0_g1_i10.p1  ORF type:complete len:313 (-),score=144.40 TRINITY_DN1690_c0_g1_i10:165-1103(-)
MHLLHYLIDVLKTQQPDSCSFVDDLVAVERAAKIDSAAIIGDIAKLKKSLADVESEIKVAQVHEADKFVPVMTDFLRASLDRFDKIQARMDTLQREADETVKMFGERDGTKWEEFFKIFDDFAKSFVEAEKQVEKMRIAREKEEKRLAALRAQEEAQQKLLAEQMARNAPPPPPPEEENKVEEKADEGEASPEEITIEPTEENLQDEKKEEEEKKVEAPAAAAPAAPQKDVVDNVFGSLRKGDTSSIIDEIRKRRQANQQQSEPTPAPGGRRKSKINVVKQTVANAIRSRKRGGQTDDAVAEPIPEESPAQL